MKKTIVILMAKILDKWGYKFSITKESKPKYTIGDYIMEKKYPNFYKHDNTPRLFIQSNINTNLNSKKHLHIENKSKIGTINFRSKDDIFSCSLNIN